MRINSHLCIFFLAKSGFVCEAFDVSKRSQQQEAIRQAIWALARPATPPEILTMAAKQVPGLGLATVYRGLGRLIESGEVGKVEIPGRPPHYERANQGHHHFFVCEDCQKMFDLHGCSGGFQKMIPPGFQMKSHEIVIYGTCKQCVPCPAHLRSASHIVDEG
jgi:Fur family ferric uptake transcriptional regulator